MFGVLGIGKSKEKKPITYRHSTQCRRSWVDSIGIGRRLFVYVSGWMFRRCKYVRVNMLVYVLIRMCMCECVRKAVKLCGVARLYLCSAFNKIARDRKRKGTKELFLPLLQRLRWTLRIYVLLFSDIKHFHQFFSFLLSKLWTIKYEQRILHFMPKALSLHLKRIHAF